MDDCCIPRSGSLRFVKECQAPDGPSGETTLEDQREVHDAEAASLAQLGKIQEDVRIRANEEVVPTRKQILNAADGLVCDSHYHFFRRFRSRKTAISSPERPREAQKGPERPREVQKGPEMPRET